MTTTLSAEQHWNPDDYARNASFVPELGMPLVELLAPRPGERILDLGCGDGALTFRLLGLGCDVVGVDSSPRMIEAAIALGLDARVMDGAALGFENEFDAVFSNAALHWMPEPEKVLAGVQRSLKPGGRFVGEFGGHGNVAAIVSAIESALSARGLTPANPWYFPRPAAYRELLEAAGFDVTHLESFPRPTPLPGDVGGWLQTFAQPYTVTLAPAEREAFVAEVVNALWPLLCDRDGVWRADYVRLRFAAHKPGTP